MLDSYRLENCFDDLLNVFSERNALAFSSCLFPICDNSSKRIDSFKKLIYNTGNPDEIYTKKERLLIDNISLFSVCSEFYMYEKHRRVLCRLIAIDLTSSTSLVYDALATMKICNKALDGFNTYIIVGSNTIHVGCDIFSRESKTSCSISYPINNKINWEALLYVFSDITDDNGFLKYYYSLLDAILSVFTCYESVDENLYDTNFYHCSEDEEEQWYNPSDETLYHNEQETTDEFYDSLISFENEVEDAKNELDFIKSNRINTLDMLFEAEKKIVETNNDYQIVDIFEVEEDIYSEELHVLLSNPDELIKVLKNKNK